MRGAGLFVLLALSCSRDPKAADPPIPASAASPAPPPASVAPAPKPALPAPPAPAIDHAELPIVALWRASGGAPRPGRPATGPALRAALFADGRFVFLRDEKRWDGPQAMVRLTPAATKKLLNDIVASGVFALEGDTYLVPDAPTLAILVRDGARQRMLYWDEVDSANYGINVDPQPRHLAFKKTWRAISQSLLAARPKAAATLRVPLIPPPAWRVQPPIQSP